MKVTPAQTDSFIERPTPTVRVFLLYGPDQGLVRARAERLAARLVADPRDPFAVSALSAAQAGDPPARLADEMAAIPFGGGRRLVWVGQGGGADSLAAAIAALLGAPPAGDGVVLIEAGDLDKKSKLRAACETDTPLAAAIACYPPDAAARAGLVASLIRAEGASIDRDTARALADMLPPDSAVVASEIVKLVLYIGSPRAITPEDIRACVSGAAESDMDGFLHAVALGDKTRAMRLLDPLWEEQTSPVALLRAAQRHWQRLHIARGWMDTGLSADAAVKKLAPPVFWKHVDATARQVARWPADRLMRRLRDLLEAEAAVKRSGVNDKALCAQLFLSMAAKG